jgi:hypothetical protein
MHNTQYEPGLRSYLSLVVFMYDKCAMCPLEFAAEQVIGHHRLFHLKTDTPQQVKELMLKYTHLQKKIIGVTWMAGPHFFYQMSVARNRGKNTEKAKAMFM